MKKLLLYTLVLMSVNELFSQNSLPKVVPVSPEASSLGKYGDLPVNFATGRINYTIPIFTIKEGNFELPIYLSYNHSGLLAEEDPGLVGLGWTLHAGGMIVRQLRGKPDEGSLGYIKGNIGRDWVIPFNYSLWNNLSINERKSKEFNLFNGSDTGRLDTQPDKFIINAVNLSGNFSYNEEGDAIFYPHKNYRVKYNNGYIITDDNGIVYSFKAQENTFSEPITNHEMDNPPMSYISSWGLTKIEFPNSSNSIDVHYEQGGSYYKEGFSESKSVIIHKLGSSKKCTTLNNLIRRSQINTTILSKQKISRIDFSGGSINFDIRTVPISSKSKSKNYLHSITIKDKNDQVINTYSFVFDNLLSNFKLLREIKKFGKNNVQIPFYKLEYNGVPPTSIFYANQDSWGYFNGKNNQYLMNGNRGVDFSKASLGALTKIIYPTTGFTKINYEPNKVPLLSNSFSQSGQCFTTPINKTELLSAISSNNPNPPDKTILIKSDQVIRVRLRASTGGQGIAEARADISNSGGELSCRSFNLCNSNNSCLTSVQSVVELGDFLDRNDDRISYFKVKTNTTLILSAETVSANAFGAASISVDYFDPDLITSENNYVEVGGIRVASTQDCISNTNCINKSFKYKLETGITSGKILYEPIYSYNYDIRDVSGSCKIEQSFSNSRIPLSSFQGAPVLYKRVEILSNGDESDGKIVKYFTTGNILINSFPFPPKNPKNWRKGKLEKEEIFQKKGGLMVLINKKENIYSIAYPFPTGLEYKKRSMGQVAGRDRFLYSSFGLIEGDPNDYQEMSYVNRPEFYHLTSSKTLENGVNTIQNFTYDSTSGYLKDQKTTTSDGKVSLLRNTYPISGRLVTENRISNPVKIEMYKNNFSLSNQETVYANFSTGNLYLPKFIKTLKGVSNSTNKLEDRIIYHSYDNKGNPTEVSKKDGTHTVYIWGYNQTQPIAKIENATLAEIGSSTIISLQNLSNLDKDARTENNLRSALNNLRNNATYKNKWQVTTYTYDPLIGVTSITDPRGETLYYEYDVFNRLQYVKDTQGNVLKEHQYHYKQN